MSRIFATAIIASLIFVSCQQKEKRIVKREDYVQYLQAGSIETARKSSTEEILFWGQRSSNDTGSYVNKLELAINYLHRFKLTGEINDLLTGDSLLKRSSEKLGNKDADILFALSQNSITQHQFTNAVHYNEEALKSKGDPYVNKLLEFDSKMELGQYYEAGQALNAIADKSSFDFLIRRAKLEDHSGNQDGSIRLMETAFEKIKNKKKSLYCWTLSNLGDMYGHAGRVEDAYKAYLDVLKKDPSNLYCLKGIAWIAYSHDGNNGAARQILNFILSQTKMPDLKLMLADIAGSEGDIQVKKQLLHEFVNDISQPGYGGMYNKYLIHLYNDDLEQSNTAITIAEKELKNRFTPETCDWLAWSYYNNGDKKKAMDYAKAYVYKRTFEPEALMHTAFIFADNGRKDEAKLLLKECLQADLELGPSAMKKIKEKLNSL